MNKETDRIVNTDMDSTTIRTNRHTHHHRLTRETGFIIYTV